MRLSIWSPRASVKAWGYSRAIRERFMRAAAQHPHPTRRKGASMLDRTATQFSHVKPGDTEFVSGGLRDFFLYRDLGVAAATNGKVIAHLVKANMAPEAGTGWHRHEADFQIVIMVKGWARFMYEDKETLVEAGDVVHQRPGIRHYLFDYSPDMEYLEIVSPADFKSVDVEPVCEIPPPTPWA
jgi:quercetin dioxygenase-like cupin family protein